MDHDIKNKSYVLLDVGTFWGNKLNPIFESIFFLILTQTPEIGQGLGRILSCGAHKPEQT